MTGKRFDPPRPAWNILKRLGQLADGYDPDWNRVPVERIPSPVQPVAAPPDLRPGKIETTAGRPVSVAAVRDCEAMP